MPATEGEMKAFGKLISEIALQKKRMSRDEARAAYVQIVTNMQPELQQGAFLLAHIVRGPTHDELAGVWDALDACDTVKMHCKRPGPVCDIVGTGADFLKTINCSTPASLIASACGLNVAKKGSRNSSGGPGSTDIFEALGIDVRAPLARSAESLEKCGYCFLPAEVFLKSGWPRLIQSMRFPSVFNIVGPLTKPCVETASIVVGAYSPHICNVMLDILLETGFKSAIAAYGMADGRDLEEGMDEISPCGETLVAELSDGKTSSYETHPSDFGAKACRLQDVMSGPNAAANAIRILSVLKERKAETPEGSFFCLNAAAMLKVSGLAPDFKKGYFLAMEALASGKAYEKLCEFKTFQGRLE